MAIPIVLMAVMSSIATIGSASKRILSVRMVVAFLHRGCAILNAIVATAKMKFLAMQSLQAILVIRVTLSKFRCFKKLQGANF